MFDHDQDRRRGAGLSLSAAIPVERPSAGRAVKSAEVLDLEGEVATLRAEVDALMALLNSKDAYVRPPVMSTCGLGDAPPSFVVTNKTPNDFYLDVSGKFAEVVPNVDVVSEYNRIARDMKIRALTDYRDRHDTGPTPGFYTII